MKLIDAEDFSRVIKEYFKDCIEHKKNKIDVLECNADIQHFLEAQSTAYNVDAVVAELKEKTILMANSKEFWDNPQNGKYVSEVIPIEGAIEIVKKGGVTNGA